MFVAFVAGETANRRMILEMLGIDRGNHFDHLAGGFLFFLVIQVHLVLDVAELAILAERPCKIPHGIDELGCGKILERRLHVLETLLGGLLRRAERSGGGVRLL